MDEASFEGWARSRTPALLRLATALTGNREDAADLVQDALVKVYPRWSSVRVMDRPEGYVTRIMVNRHISDRRRADRAVRRDALFAPVEIPPADGGALDRAELVPALQTLGARQRSVLILRYYLDWPDDRIAEALGCTEGTVRSQASRGLAAVRARLAGESNDAAEVGPMRVAKGSGHGHR